LTFEKLKLSAVAVNPDALQGFSTTDLKAELLRRRDASSSAMAELDRQEEDALGEMARFALDRAENMRSSIKKHQYMMRLAFIFQKFVPSCRKYV
jgi:hypothetical protein